MQFEGRTPRCPLSLLKLLVALGREAEARAEVKAWLAADPTVTLKALERHGRRQPFKDPGFLAPMLALVHRAGIPE